MKLVTENSEADTKARDEEFVRHYVDNGGNATQAAIAVGVSKASASTIGYRLKNRLTDEIDAEQRQALKGYAPTAIKQIVSLAQSAESENVRLKANMDLLDRAGWGSILKQEVTQVNDLSTKTTEELEAELAQLLKDVH